MCWSICCVAIVRKMVYLACSVKARYHSGNPPLSTVTAVIGQGTAILLATNVTVCRVLLVGEDWFSLLFWAALAVLAFPIRGDWVSSFLGATFTVLCCTERPTEAAARPSRSTQRALKNGP